MIETDTVRLPAFLAPALINGDVTGLETPEDLQTLEKALTYIDGWNITLDNEAEPYFARTSDIGGLAGDMLDYTIWRQVK